MKKLANIILGAWCAITCFISPVWLTLVFLNLTGLIYKYDYSMDEGTAGIIGVILLVLWIVAALLPNVVFIKKHKKNRLVILVFVVLLSLLCIGMCEWNLVGFLVEPRGA